MDACTRADGLDEALRNEEGISIEQVLSDPGVVARSDRSAAGSGGLRSGMREEVGIMTCRDSRRQCVASLAAAQVRIAHSYVRVDVDVRLTRARL